jgi:hypothetical protein
VLHEPVFLPAQRDDGHTWTWQLTAEVRCVVLCCHVPCLGWFAQLAAKQALAGHQQQQKHTPASSYSKPACWLQSNLPACMMPTRSAGCQMLSACCLTDLSPA